MSLKAKIKNYSKKTNLPPQLILQNYIFESFLKRLSQSNFKDKIVLKGGILIASLIGIENRSTMDMDATVKNYPLDPKSIALFIEELSKIELNDGIIFSQG